MAVFVMDAEVEERLKAEREESGADRFDEVWEGVYMMAPLADDDHQDLQAGLVGIFHFAIQRAGIGKVRGGVNVSDREQGWTHNYRVPDVAVFLPGGPARNCGTHWVGGPDFAVEIASPRDRSRDKLDFYAKIGVRELLLIDRQPWALESYRLDGNRLDLIGQSAPARRERLASGVLPLSFDIAPGTPRPQVEVSHHDDVQHWTI